MIYVYEDLHALDLEPLTLTRATFELRYGAFTHLERIRKVVGDQQLTLVVRPEMAAVVQETYPDLPVNPQQVEAGLWLNGVAVWDKAAWKQLQGVQGFVGADGRITGGNLDAGQSGDFYTALRAGTDLAATPAAEGPKLLPYLWNHFLTSGEQVSADFEQYYRSNVATDFPTGVHVIGDKGVYVGEDVTLDPAVILDTRHGPIIIEEGATVSSHSVVAGPTYIGPRCKVWPFAFLEEATLGPVCRVMGQLEACILQGYTNKQHDGFMGHAYLGSWVNLGAGTTNSDLKNNYGSVRVSVNGRTMDTGETFVGCFIGDHSKSAIGTLLYTGTRVGVAANLFGDVIPPKLVPSFAWGGDGSARYDLDKCLETMAVVKSRRKHEFTQAERELYTRLFKEAG